MKKFLSSIIALSLCGLMLTACSSNEDNAETTTVSETTSTEELTVSDSETEKSESEIEETTTANDVDTAVSDASGYASMEDFAASDVFSLSTEEVPFEESLTYAFSQSLTGATELYIDMEMVGSNGMGMAMAVTADNKMSMNMSYPDFGLDMTMLYKDSTLYNLDNTSKTGEYTVNESFMDDYDLATAFEQIGVNESLLNTENISKCTVDIGGKEYTFEVAGESGGILFDSEGDISLIISLYEGVNVAFITHDYSNKVPDGIFEIPADYTLTEITDAEK